MDARTEKGPERPGPDVWGMRAGHPGQVAQ